MADRTLPDVAYFLGIDHGAASPMQRTVIVLTERALLGAAMKHGLTAEETLDVIRTVFAGLEVLTISDQGIHEVNVRAEEAIAETLRADRAHREFIQVLEDMLDAPVMRPVYRAVGPAQGVKPPTPHRICSGRPPRGGRRG